MRAADPGVHRDQSRSLQFSQGIADDDGIHIDAAREKIAGQLLRSVKGRITPAFSWQSPETFQQNGMGFCAVCGDIPAGWAFSAAVSDNEIDIGVETAAEHRRNGLAEACASAMIQEILRRGKTPVWACAGQNAASAALACKLGFVPAGKCTVIQADI
jgi:RimJ/RimL family protein N-acetyltransferase